MCCDFVNTDETLDGVLYGDLRIRSAAVIDDVERDDAGPFDLVCVDIHALSEADTCFNPRAAPLLPSRVQLTDLCGYLLDEIGGSMKVGMQDSISV